MYPIWFGGIGELYLMYNIHDFIVMKRKNIIQLVLVIFILSTGAGLSWYFLGQTTVPQPKDQQEREWVIRTATVQYGNFSPMITLYGTVEAPQKATVRSALNADVMDVLVQEGQVVKAGDVLITLDDQDAQLTLTQRHADVKIIEAQIDALEMNHQADLRAMVHEKKVLSIEASSFHRLTKLASEDHLSKDALDKAEQGLSQTRLAVTLRQKALDNYAAQHKQLTAQHAQAMVMLKKAKRDVDRATIKSPIDGVVTQRLIAKGDRVSPGSAVCAIKPIGEEEVRVQVPEHILTIFVSAIKAQQPIRGQVKQGDNEITLHLDRVSPQTQNTKLGAEVLFITRDKAKILREGAVVTMNVTLPELQGVYAISSQALYGRDVIYQVVNDRLEPVKIDKLGDKDNAKGKADIIFTSEKVNRKTVVMISQLPNAYPGLKVKVMSEDPDKAKTE